MIGLYPIGLYITLHVAIPTLHPIAHGIQCHTVQYPAVHSPISRRHILQADPLCPFRQQIVPEPVMLLQVLVQFLQQLLLAQGFHFLLVCICFVLPLYVLYRNNILHLPGSLLLL